jgi:hypothetical protein
MVVTADFVSIDQITVQVVKLHVALPHMFPTIMTDTIISKQSSFMEMYMSDISLASSALTTKLRMRLE